MAARNCGWLVLLALLRGLAGGAEPTYSLPDYGGLEPPLARPRAEVMRLLEGTDSTPVSEKVLRVLLVAGKKDHGPGEHDYPSWLEVWSRLLQLAPHTEVKTCWDFPNEEQLAGVDVMAIYQRGDWTDERARLLDAFLSRGGGVVVVHMGVNGNDRADEFAKRIGLASRTGKIGFRHGPIDIDFQLAEGHPIARNFQNVQWLDETYWHLNGDIRLINILGMGTEEGQPWPQFWTVDHKPGRVFVSIPGHYMWTFDDPAFRLLLLRGMAWTAGHNVDRFNNLVMIDARVSE